MITSGKEWIGDSDMNTSAADRERLQPEENNSPASLSAEEYRILTQCIGLCAHELFEDERDTLGSLVADGLAAVDETSNVIFLQPDGEFAVRNWEPSQAGDDAWSGGFAENH